MTVAIRPGLKKTKELILEVFDRLDAEHLATPPNWRGGPRPRHHELMTAIRSLRDVGRLIDAVVIEEARIENKERHDRLSHWRSSMTHD